MTKEQIDTLVSKLDELAGEWVGSFHGTPERQMEALDALHTVKECLIHDKAAIEEDEKYDSEH